MYKHLLISLLCLIYAFNSVAQSTLVPYRVGDKFGLSNLKGEIQLRPEFDAISQLYAKTNCFNAYKISEKSSVVSFIHNDKIVIRDQPFVNYRIDDNFIYGFQPADARYNKIRESNLNTHLFHLDGKPVFPKSIQFLTFLGTYEHLEHSNEMLMLLVDRDAQFKVVVWDKQHKKIKTTVADRFSYISHNYWRQSKTRGELTLRYADAKKKKWEMRLTIDLGEISINEPVEFLPESDEGDNAASMEGLGMLDNPISAHPEAKPQTQTQPQPEEFIYLGASTTDYSYPKKVEYMYRRVGKQSPRDRFIMFKEGNYVGLKTDKDSIILEAKYDAIYPGQLYSYVVQKDNKYGLLLLNRQPNLFIEPQFDYIPIISNWLYLKEDGYIFKLFDEDGRFVCYAN